MGIGDYTLYHIFVCWARRSLMPVNYQEQPADRHVDKRCSLISANIVCATADNYERLTPLRAIWRTQCSSTDGDLATGKCIGSAMRVQIRKNNVELGRCFTPSPFNNMQTPNLLIGSASVPLRHPDVPTWDDVQFGTYLRITAPGINWQLWGPVTRRPGRCRRCLLRPWRCLPLRY